MIGGKEDEKNKGNQLSRRRDSKNTQKITGFLRRQMDREYGNLRNKQNKKITSNL